MFSVNKDRLYVCLYIRGAKPKMPGKEDTYHWALVAGPKQDGPGTVGTRYHAKENFDRPPPNYWDYTEEPTKTTQAHNLLVRVVVAKIRNKSALEGILRTIPIRAGDAQYPDWNCIGWVREALSTVQEHDRANPESAALGTSVAEWQTIRDGVMDYVQRKKDARRWAKSGVGKYRIDIAPTFDLLTREELSP